MEIDTRVQCFLVPARHRSVPRPRSSSRTERRNGKISVLRGTELNDENRRNDETGRSVPKGLQEKWMENTLKWVKNPNFFAPIGTAGDTFLELKNEKND